MSEVCGPGGIPGSPADLRQAAELLEGSRILAEDMPVQVRSGRERALAGWSGSAADAFDGWSAGALACAERLVEVGPAAAGPLRVYAEELEDAQNAFKRALANERSAERDLADAESARDERSAERDVYAARDTKAAAFQAAVDANERAARKIQAVVDGVPVAPDAPKLTRWPCPRGWTSRRRTGRGGRSRCSRSGAERPPPYAGWRTSANKPGSTRTRSTTRWRPSARGSSPIRSASSGR